jgi:predicted PurR-regulated permease PerM
MLLSVPVQTLSRIMTRRSRGLAIVVTVLVVAGLIVVGALFVVRRLVAHFATLAHALPVLAETGRLYLLVVLGQLDEWGLLAGTPEQAAPKIERDISERIGGSGAACWATPPTWSRGPLVSPSTSSGSSSSRPTCSRTCAG